MKKSVCLLALLLPAFSQAADLEFRAAGSLKTAMTDVIASYQADGGVKVNAQFAPSGLLRGRIEEGEKVDLFASANMKHPQKLMQEGKGAPVVMFARNRLCALAQDNVPLTTENMLDTLLDSKIKLGTSTPKADPAGDYAFKVFDRAEAIKPGSQAKLAAKALKLTGGADSAKAPKGKNPYGWVMANKRADVFLTYCTNAVLAKKEVPDLKIVALPESLAVGANYGMLVLDKADSAAWPLAMYILSPKGQSILASYGFEAPLKP
ncbi:molybdate ABC transporter substrate-binding protein [Shewanella algae]|uniref:molybdate ABC transporter substrate-binding protein n=1 Tax=Shewanella algae TaxID=38313 RepID=UPI000D14F91F|nr:molybdate ABC transporter substrate-binding protein [Shewanella algae]MBO2617619.1 molybdate ABC transporter substrate-binding protein [Shewanella algae]MBO2638616.1 molybdate ABC transporter substrate-binding protein [Shewanella algae]MCE9777671.1 molybdate ABC transporter substrate-binding protein [Shewanella algae]MCE9825822.1 molybdate ABC transporter substrate-binding protein [Shewanella algae]PST68134.1 molybdate ABC transporter substrate-binding protein [Shewanella algae]